MAIIITTADLKRDYDVLDTIFAVDSNSAGIFKSADPGKAFEGVKQQLRTKCQQIGGDAIVGCEFQYREALDGKKQAMEIWAYGTAVKMK